jgi:hypothetical protein
MGKLSRVSHWLHGNHMKKRQTHVYAHLVTKPKYNVSFGEGAYYGQFPYNPWKVSNDKLTLSRKHWKNHFRV